MAVLWHVVGAVSAMMKGGGNGFRDTWNFVRFSVCVLTEEVLYQLDAGAHKSHVLQPFRNALFQADPHPRSLDVHTYIINIRVLFGEANGIFSLAASKLKDDRIIITEEFAPFAF